MFAAGLATHVVIFVLGAIVIGLGGTRMSSLADRLADRTGLGEAAMGVILLGFVTALPGVSASVTAALGGYPALAVSNALGGIAVQTTFLAVADLFHRQANLEHAAASVSNMMQTAVLVLLMTLVLIGISGPEITVFHVHPITVALLAAAGVGFWLSFRTGQKPMWKPYQTKQTIEDVPNPKAERESLRWLLVGFMLSAAIVLAAGAFVANSAGALATETSISQTIMGGLFLACATSLPELVTTIAAVRRGAVTLAVSDIVGGNFFDVLFLCIADVAFFSGSLYHADGVGMREIFLIALAILLNIVLLIGLLYRQRSGPVNIGFESVGILILYGAGMLILAFTY